MSKNSTIEKAATGTFWTATVSVSLLAIGTLGGVRLLAAPPVKKTAASAKMSTKTVPMPKTMSTVIGDNTPLTETQRILHVLNRLGYGARPGDVERVRQMGLSTYIDIQLHPEQLQDNAVEAKLAAYDSLQKPASQLLHEYVDGQRNLKRLKKTGLRLAANTQTVTPTDAASMTVTQTMTDAAKMTDATMTKKKRRQLVLQNLTPEQRVEMQQLMAQQTGKKGAAIAAQQLAMAKVIRAVESQKQLNEVLVDFWSNHFNIDIRKKTCRALKIADDRDTIRPNVLGRFRDLLEASAKSPAMLVYLDNDQSSVAHENDPRYRQIVQRRTMQNGATVAKKALQRAKGGINENYAREIMELHTLGVDGGYTQKDVQEVARCLTGWTIRRGDGGFNFDPRRHDDGEKIVLGHRIPANGGIEDGEKVLDLLASNPATMHHVSFQLCQKLVADEPPASLVDKCVATWKRTDGNIREIVRTIVTSPEFYSRAAYRQKIKSPFEYVVSSIRAIGATVDAENGGGKAPRLTTKGGNNANTSLPGQTALMGEALFQCQPPTGYPLDSRKWVSTGALIARLNFALKLTNAQMPAVNLDDAHKIVPDGTPLPQSVNYLGDTLLGGELTPSTRATLLKEIKQSDGKEVIGTRRVAALILGSPEFQRH